MRHQLRELEPMTWELIIRTSAVSARFLRFPAQVIGRIMMLLWKKAKRRKKISVRGEAEAKARASRESLVQRQQFKESGLDWEGRGRVLGTNPIFSQFLYLGNRKSDIYWVLSSSPHNYPAGYILTLIFWKKTHIHKAGGQTFERLSHPISVYFSAEV